MTLRSKIEAAIAAGNGDSKQAAIKVCLLLEDEIGLWGNGWFEDDAEFEKLLSDED